MTGETTNLNLTGEELDLLVRTYDEAVTGFSRESRQKQVQRRIWDAYRRRGKSGDAETVTLTADDLAVLESTIEAATAATRKDDSPEAQLHRLIWGALETIWDYDDNPRQTAIESGEASRRWIWRF